MATTNLNELNEASDEVNAHNDSEHQDSIQRQADVIYDMAPSKCINKMYFQYSQMVKTVNGEAPDESGNVTIGGSYVGEKVEYVNAGNYTFVVPKGVTTIYVSAVAGGGSGTRGSDRSGGPYNGGHGGHGACLNREPMIVKSQQVIEITVGSGGTVNSATSSNWRVMDGRSGTATVVGEITLTGGGGIYEPNHNGYTGSSPSPNGCDTSSWGAYSSRGSGGAGGRSYNVVGSAGQNGYVRIEW